MFHNFFLENFIDGIIPPIDPKKPLYKGGYGRGEGVPTPYRGVYGGSNGLLYPYPPPLGNRSTLGLHQGTFLLRQSVVIQLRLI